MREVNGQQYQHATTRVIIKATGGELRLNTFSRVRLRESVGSEPTRNAQGQIDGFTYGDQEIEFEIELKQSEWWTMRSFLYSHAAGRGVAQAIFDCPVSFGNNINALKRMTAQGCHVTEEAIESTSDQSVLMVTVPMFCTSIAYPEDEPFIVYDDE